MKDPFHASASECPWQSSSARDERGVGEERGKWGEEWSPHHVVMRIKSEDLESLEDNVARLEWETHTENTHMHRHVHT